MIINNIKIGLRTLRKNKVYTTINILGLSTGIAAVLLIYHMVSYELSFNKNFANYDQIVRLVQIDNSSIDGADYSICVPIPAMDQVEEKISQIEKITRIKEQWGTLTVPQEGSSVPLKKFKQTYFETAFFAEPNFLEIFDFKWLEGEPATALNDPASIILSKTWAEKCFNKWENAMGKTVLIDNLVPVVVKGVIEDMPENVDFPLPFIISYETLLNHKDLFFHQESWNSCSSNNQVFGLLHQGASLIEANILAADIGREEYKDESGVQRKVHHLQPLSELHYDQQYGHSGTHSISIGRLKVLGLIGLLILLIGCFNFINLATAQSLLRAKEVGVRKTLGSTRRQLVSQFMGETGIIVVVSIIIGSYLAFIATPLLQYVSNVPDSQRLFSNPSVLIFLGIAAILITFLAGLYPALALSNYKPVQALNNQADRGSFGAAAIRKTLVILQFGVALALIISAIVTLKQLDYIKSQDLGFNDDFIYTFNFNNDEKTVRRQNALKRELEEIPAVEAISFSSDQPLSDNTWDTNFKYSSRPEYEKFGMSLRFCDRNYFDTYGIEFIAGQAFKHSDTMSQCVINMTVLRKIGITDPNEAIGQRIYLGGGSLEIPIAGVVSDFHTHSFRQQHEPLLLISRKEFYGTAGIKIHNDNTVSTLESIKLAYDKVLPEQVFDGSFLDDNIAQLYENDNRLAATCWAFGILAIFISCLGLFGLATHTVTQRVKEIGIRKVLGANVVSIVSLLSKDFMKLVIVALLVASPLAWLVMEKWLENFAYRIDIQLWIFILAGVVTISIALITVSFQSIKAAIINPIESLRNE